VPGYGHSRLKRQATHYSAARITWVEVLSALARREREGSLTPTDRTLIIQKFRSDLNDQYQVIELDAKLAETAGQLVGQYPLRAYDALQMASVLRIQSAFTTRSLSRIVPYLISVFLPLTKSVKL